MPVVFDEVVGSVEPERGADTNDAAASTESGGSDCDVQEVRRALERMAVRHARLFAD